MNVDMRHANIAIKPSHIPVPTVHTLRHKLNGACYFSKLDMRHAFHQMLLSEKSRNLTNFYTPEGIYRMKRLIMGAGPASQEFHERLRRSIADLDGVLQIEDDLLVYGGSHDEHNLHLDKLLARLQEIGVTLRKEKCLWAVTEVIWFGYKFSKEGMSADPAKVKAVTSLPPPMNSSEVKSFLQMCQYNALFMFNNEDNETYSDITAPLRALLRKGVKFHWSEACQTSFQKLKDGLASENVISHSEQNRKTELVVDRGPKGIAATLYQQEPDTGYWKTINYKSRSLSPTEQRYVPIEGESLAIMYGVTENRMYLYGQHFDVITDHEPLVSLYNNPKKKGPARVNNHRLNLQGYTFKVSFRRGESNSTDYNSRHPSEPSTPSTSEDDVIFINAIIDADLPDAVTEEMIQKETNNDHTLAQLKYCLLTKGYIPKDHQKLQPFQRVFEELSVAHQLVLRGTRIVIPESLQPDVIALAHEGHQAVSKMKSYLRSRVWFPDMDRLIENYVNSCLTCQASTPQQKFEPLRPTPTPQGPWRKLSTDFKGPIAKDFYFLLVMDDYSRFPELEIVSSTSAEEVIPKFDRILATHGIPEEVRSDNGPPF